jgi:hypothetical protein
MADLGPRVAAGIFEEKRCVQITGDRPLLLPPKMDGEGAILERRWQEHVDETDLIAERGDPWTAGL